MSNLNRVIIHKDTVTKETESPYFLRISELTMGVMQGEGVYSGYPSIILRLQGCILDCVWCDSTRVWSKGVKVSVKHLIQIFESYGIIEKLKEGQHLIITGGSPLLQQKMLIKFLEMLTTQYHFMPFIELENEAVIYVSNDLVPFISCWNNSPKLSSSKVSKSLRYQPEMLRRASKFINSWFKFVIYDDESWNEIETMFLNTNLIRKEQVILMPGGSNAETVLANTKYVAELAIRKSVKFTNRNHIIVWSDTIYK